MTTLAPGSLAIWRHGIDRCLVRVMDIRDQEATIKRPDLSASTALLAELVPVKEVRIGRDAVGAACLFVDSIWYGTLPSWLQLLDPQTLKLPNDPPDSLATKLGEIHAKLEETLRITGATQQNVVMHESLLAANRGNARLASELKQARELLRNHEDNLVKALAERDTLSRDLSDARELLKTHGEKIRSLTEQIDTLQLQVAKLTGERNRAIDALDDERKRAERLAAKLVNTENAHADKCSTLAALRVEIERAHNKNSDVAESIRICKELLK